MMLNSDAKIGQSSTKKDCNDLTNGNIFCATHSNQKIFSLECLALCDIVKRIIFP